MILWLTSLAFGGVDPACNGKEPVPYYEQVQADFLQNYFALASSFSPIHGPIPHDPGRGAVGMDLAVIPPLSCSRRFALNASKTEAANRSPVLPRPRVTFALPLTDDWVATGGFGFVPPLPIAGQKTTVISAEAGVGWQFSERLQLGARLHATSQKTVADIATSLNPEDAPAPDLFVAHSYGLDLLGGIPLGPVTPYVALGITDVSTLFWIGDDGVMANNLHPYLGPVASLGAEGLYKRLRWSGEFYAAPGGHTRPIKSYPNEVGFGGYGHLYTVRLRAAYEFGRQP